jgi:lathosterol oxidase
MFLTHFSALVLTLPEWTWLYKVMHSVHHQYGQVEHSVFSLFYVHPVEMALSNVCFFCGILVFPTDLFSIFIFGSISSAFVGAGHSGLLLPAWLDRVLDPSFHQLHHSHYRCNYSEHFTIVDRLFGTYRELSKEEKAERAMKASKEAQ